MTQRAKPYLSGKDRREYKRAVALHAAGELNDEGLRMAEALHLTDDAMDAARYLSPALQALHETSEDLHEMGLISGAKMAELDAKCLAPHHARIEAELRKIDLSSLWALAKPLDR